jgi:hypothetical protein
VKSFKARHLGVVLPNLNADAFLAYREGKI